MNITIINYFVFLLLIGGGVFFLIKNPASVNARIIAFFSFAAAITGALIGLSFDFGNAGWLELSKWIVRAAGITAFGMYLITFRLALTFPYEKKRLSVSIILFIIWAGISVLYLTTDLYIIGIELRNGIFFRIEGSFYKLFTLLGVAITIAALTILLVRRKKFENEIYRLQSILIISGTSFAIIIGILITIIIPSYFQIFTLYPLSGLMGFVMEGSFLYAVVTYRMFDIRTAIHKTLVFLIFSSVTGIAAGLSFGAVHEFLKIDIIPLTVVFIGVFIALMILRDIFQNRISRLFRRKTEYLTELEKSLDDIDYSGGRDKVIESFSKACREYIGNTAFSILLENTIGELVNIFSLIPRNIRFEKNDPMIKFLVNQEQSVILKTEVYSNPLFNEYRVEILDMFLQMDAEIVVIFREGTNMIGLIALGPKEGMKPYDINDYRTMEKLLPKFFVVIYFLRNVEKLSVAVTVDKELKFSEQIIKSLLKNIDEIGSDKMEFHFLNRVTSGLGGDFVDVIRFSPSRTMVIMGDIAGKGMNASMSMIIMKSVIRTFLKETHDFKSLVIKANSFIKSHLPRGTFFAGVFMIYDSSANQLYYINCGVPLMYLYSKVYNSVIEIQGDGKVLGFVKDVSKYITIKKVQLNQGDLFITATDGIIESHSIGGEVFGKNRIQQHIMETKEKGTQEVIETLFDKFMKFISGSLNDDITILGMKYTAKKIQS
jgi:serine phosphatase RsbU (regulator of sigma subunit)